MNIFSYYKQLENHCTNILMNLLAMNDAELLRPFLDRFIPGAAGLAIGEVFFSLFTEYPPAGAKRYEYIIGIAPFLRKESEKEVSPNPGSIPDAWIVGENFRLLFEFKVSGTLNDGQFAAHGAKLSPNAGQIELTWKQIGEAMRSFELVGQRKWLIDQFCELIAEFESPQPASGMPKQIISRRKAQPNETYFVINGNQRSGIYTVDVVRPGEPAQRILDKGTGIQSNRRWIQQYIQGSNNMSSFLDVDGLVIDCCESPGRRKPEWNRWPLGAF